MVSLKTKKTVKKLVCLLLVLTLCCYAMEPPDSKLFKEKKKGKKARKRRSPRSFFSFSCSSLPMKPRKIKSDYQEKLGKSDEEKILTLCVSNKRNSCKNLRRLVNSSDLMPKEINEITDEEGNTLLHIASRRGNLEKVKLLVEEKKANIMARNKVSELAVHLALAHGYTKVTQYLKQCMINKIITDNQKCGRCAQNAQIMQTNEIGIMRCCGNFICIPCMVSWRRTSNICFVCRTLLNKIIE